MKIRRKKKKKKVPSQLWYITAHLYRVHYSTPIGCSSTFLQADILRFGTQNKFWVRDFPFDQPA